MELLRMIEALSNAAAYAHAVEAVEVRQTHISVVFLAGRYAYKVKKPVNLGFLDFSTLDQRRHFCEEEVRLNRRLAPQVYLGTVPVVRTSAGIKVEAPWNGEIIEWAVKMERLPDEATFQKRLQHGEIDVTCVQALARKIAAFHVEAEAGEHISTFGRFDVVARNARENFEQAGPQAGTTVSQTVLDRLRSLSDETLIRLQPLIESRAAQGMPRDTHGDLHLDHVYLFPDTQLVIIDCIEFNERFRFADPVADMAFLVMDLVFHGRRDLAQEFADEYFLASGDEEGRALLPFYTAYRAAVRGKVEGFELLEKEIPEGERRAALARARAHWLLALGELEAPGRRPALVVVGGLPGTGKSTLAQDLARKCGFHVIRSDLVRKELAGLSAQDPAHVAFAEGIYGPKWTERTYAECLHRAEKLLFEGQRVIVDASFRQESNRQAFMAAAAALGVPAAFLLCRADTEVIRRRLASRRGDVSDADWSIYQKATESWEEMGPLTREVWRDVPTGETREQALAHALAFLAKVV